MSMRLTENVQCRKVQLSNHKNVWDCDKKHPLIDIDIFLNLLIAIDIFQNLLGHNDICKIFRYIDFRYRYSIKKHSIQYFIDIFVIPLSISDVLKNIFNKISKHIDININKIY